MPSAGPLRGQITFLYYDRLEPAGRFYGTLLELPLVEDQGWARIYATAPGAFLGIVDSRHGSLRANRDSAVLITLVVDAVQPWYEALSARGAQPLAPPRRHPTLALEHFFLSDPGGYRVEVQSFLDPAARRRFAGAATAS